MDNQRVYRFEDVIGNFSTVSIIKSCIANNSFPNFTIMSGDSGTGKSTCAEIVSLALNCENPVDCSPCLKCNSCRINLASLQGKGNSTRVRKINMADSEVKKDISNVITQIFKLDVSSGKSVFILEEVHSLSESHQTALLEEIDKLSDNVYVILCTTKPNRLLEELRNRSIMFRFSKLRSSESSILLEKILNRNHIMIPNNIKDEIIKHSKGVPRVIVKLTDLVLKNNCTYDQVTDLLGVIKPKVFNMLFRSCSDFSSYLASLNELMMDYSLDQVVYNLKKYVMDLHFLSAGVSTFYSNTTQKDKELSIEIGKSNLYKIQNLIYSSDVREDCDFVFMMLKVRTMILTPSTTNSQTKVPSSTNSSLANSANSTLMRNSSIYKAPNEVAIDSMKKSEMLESNVKGNGLTKLNLNRLKELGD